jgi:TPR repeat protein
MRLVLISLFVVATAAADPAALATLRKACDAGDAKACSNAGRMLGDGDGVPQDVPAATKLLAKGCAGKNNDACRMLGNAAKLLEQDGKQLPLAISAFQQLCDRDVGGACSEAGWILENTKGPAKTFAKLYERGCKLDDAAGCFHQARLGHDRAGFEHACRMHDARGCAEAIKGEKSPAKAFAFYEEACRLDDQDTCKQGCRAGDAEACQYAHDDKRALELRTKGCAANDAKSCSSLSFAYHHGEGGVKLDHARARDFDAKACKLGALDACYDVAERKFKGLDEPEDKAGGVAAYEDLCKRGYATACGSLGFLYRSGDAVTKDEAQAAKMFSQGCVESCAWCCYEAAQQIHDADKNGAIDKLKSACRWGDSRACEMLANAGISVRQDPAHHTVTISH